MIHLQKTYTSFQYITSFVEAMPSEMFDQFLAHMNRCATAYRAQNEREQRRVTLSQLFMSCDNAGVSSPLINILIGSDKYNVACSPL